MGMPAEQQSPLGGDGYVSLYEILDAFGAPISEEHAWALAYQTCKLLQKLWSRREGIASQGTAPLSPCIGSTSFSPTLKRSVPNSVSRLSTSTDLVNHNNIPKKGSSDRLQRKNGGSRNGSSAATDSNEAQNCNDESGPRVDQNNDCEERIANGENNGFEEYKCTEKLEERLSSSPEDVSVPLRKNTRHCVYLMDSLRDVRICVDGSLHASSADASAFPHNGAKGRPRKLASSEQQLVQSVGVLLFRALDFRLGPDEQRSLSPAMDLLLDQMTSAADVESQSSRSISNDLNKVLNRSQIKVDANDLTHLEKAARAACQRRLSDGDCDSVGGRISAADSDAAYNDEGIHDLEMEDETRSVSPESYSGSGLTLDKVIQMCSAHMSLGSQADSHYRAVCRAFVAEWLELTTFLSEVSKGTKELRQKSYEVCSADEDSLSNLDQLGFQDWARLWVQVIRELRQGVVLKKVRLEQGHHGPPIEYELTPYEMLLDDIRSRRYKLNKVMVNGELPPRIKKDAFALILEFIRSRPPLVPVGQRRLRQLPPREPPLHERLMDAIKQQHSLRHVTTRHSNLLDYGVWRYGSDTCGGLSLCSSATNDSDDTSQPSIGSQRRLIQVDLMFSDDDLDDSESLSSCSSPQGDCAVQSLPPKLASNQIPARRTSRLSWQTSSNDGNPGSNRRKLWRRHSIDICEPRVHLERGDTTRRSIPRFRERESSLHCTKDNCNSPTTKPLSIVNKQLECLSLTLEEVAHIRSVMTKAELETLLVVPQLYEDVSKGRICFTCRKTRFQLLFRSRPIRCSLCERNVCDKCSTKMHIPTHRFDRIPVYMLSPSSPPDDSSRQRLNSHKPNRKSKVSEQIETVVQTYTSGSAPSSPNLNSGRKGLSSIGMNAQPHEVNKDQTDYDTQVENNHQYEVNEVPANVVHSPQQSNTMSSSWFESNINSSNENKDNRSQPASESNPDRTDTLNFHNQVNSGESCADQRDSSASRRWETISKGLLKRPSILRVRARLRGKDGKDIKDVEKFEKEKEKKSGDSGDAGLTEKLKAPVLPVCIDCKHLVRSIILSNRNPIVKSHVEV